MNIFTPPHICISFPVNNPSSTSVYHLKFIYKFMGHKGQTRNLSLLIQPQSFCDCLTLWTFIVVCRRNGFRAKTFEILTQLFWAQYKGKIYLENCSLLRFNTRGPKVTKRLFSFFFCMKSSCYLILI